MTTLLGILGSNHNVFLFMWVYLFFIFVCLLSLIVHRKGEGHQRKVEDGVLSPEVIYGSKEKGLGV